MNNILIHIGYHKTATTWLQQNIFTSENNVFEPLSKKTKGSSSLARLFFYDKEKYLLSPFDDNEIRIQKAVEHLKKNNPKLLSKVPVLSHERLSGNPHSSGFDAKKIASMLKNSFPEAKILIVIREQKSFILSNYFQYLAIGGGFKLERYLSTKYDGKRPFFSPNHINYTFLINEYYRLYGKDKVLVLPYEMFDKEPSLFIRQLGNSVGVEINIEDETFKQKLNNKYNKSALYYLRGLNQFRHSSSVNDYSSLNTKFTKIFANAIFATACSIFPSRLDTSLNNRLQKQINHIIGDRYVESNKHLSKSIGIDLSLYGYL